MRSRGYDSCCLLYVISVRIYLPIGIISHVHTLPSFSFRMSFIANFDTFPHDPLINLGFRYRMITKFDISLLFHRSKFDFFLC